MLDELSRRSVSPSVLSKQHVYHWERQEKSSFDDLLLSMDQWRLENQKNVDHLRELRSHFSAQINYFVKEWIEMMVNLD